MATFVEELSLSKVFPDCTGAVFDIDGSILDNEGCQEQFWHDGVRIAFNVRDPGLSSHIEICFLTGNFPQLVPGVFRHLLELGEISPGTTLREIDAILADVRLKLILQACDEGKIRLLPGVPQIFNALRMKGWNRGLCTNSPGVVSIAMCERLLGKGVFDQAIPPGARVFGWDMPPERIKPDPFGWHLACRRGGMNHQHTIILEDRPANITQAVRSGFAGAIGMCDGKQDEFLDALGRREDNIWLVKDPSCVVS